VTIVSFAAVVMIAVLLDNKTIFLEPVAASSAVLDFVGIPRAFPYAGILRKKIAIKLKR
jgi:hypothetical protein